MQKYRADKSETAADGSIASRARDGWRIVATDINYEEPDLFCSNCNQQIDSACREY